MAQVWTKETVKQWLQSMNPENPKHREALSRALLYLYARQTADEQSTGHTNHNNGMGFTGVDAEFLSSVAQGVKKYGNMTPKQAIHVARKLVKYSGQLLGLVAERAAQQGTTQVQEIAA